MGALKTFEALVIATFRKVVRHKNLNKTSRRQYNENIKYGRFYWWDTGTINRFMPVS